MIPPGLRPPHDAVILEAPKGAILRFDGGFHPGRGKIGRFDSGEMLGKVTLRSKMKDVGTHDDLFIAAMNVQINEHRIWSNDHIAFSFGKNKGQGKMMEIRFLPAATTEGPQHGGLGIGGVRSLEIFKQVQIELAMRGKGLLPGKRLQANRSVEVTSAAADTGSIEPAKILPQPPVRVTCSGSFYFHLIQQVAEFDKNVRVSRENTTGPPDSMSCQTMLVHFAKAKANNTTANSSSSDRFSGKQKFDMVPTKLVAKGVPVQVYSASTGASARCDELTYEIEEQRVTLLSSTPEPVWLRWTQSAKRQVTIRSPGVTYQLDPDSPSERIGNFESYGPGWMTATDSDRPDAPFSVTWQKQIKLDRQEGQPVMRIVGKPQLRMQGLGNISGDEIHLWLKEPLALREEDENLREQGARNTTSVEATSKKRRQVFVLPDRMAVFGNARVDTPQIHAELDNLEIWFRHVDAKSVQNADATNSAGDLASASHSNTSRIGNQRLLRLNSNRSKDWYHLTAKLLRMELVLDGMASGAKRTEASLKNMTIEQNVRLRQFPRKLSDQELAQTVPTLEMLGHRVDILQADTPQTKVTLFGSPATEAESTMASIATQGASLKGYAIRLDRAKNMVWIDSAGEISIPLEKDLNGKLLARPQPMVVVWQEGMNFDGKSAVFNGNVLAKTVGGGMRTDRMIATLRNAILFNEAKNSKPELDTITCDGSVVADQQTVENNVETSRIHFEIPWLSISHRTGDIEGRGPGWVEYVAVAQNNGLLAGAASRNNTPQVIRGQSPEFANARSRSNRITPIDGNHANSPLRYLHIDFKKGLLGNVNHKRIEALGQVHTIYGPIDSWNQRITVDGPGWKNGAVAVDCERLKAVQWRDRTTKNSWAEIVAEGNVAMEGYMPKYGSFNAQAQRLTYDQRKDLLILDGGTKDAKLSRKAPPERRLEPTRVAASIFFALKTESPPTVPEA